jgi:hypothetical protein
MHLDQCGLEVVEMCHTKELVYYLQLHISFKVILKDPIVKQKVVTTIMFGLSGSKLCGKEIEISYVDVAMQEVFELDTHTYAKATTKKCHTNTKISKGTLILWSSKFVKFVNDAPAHNANVA